MRIRKVDANQRSLVKQIRMIPGVTVAHIHTVGQGLCDLIIGYRGKNFLVEVKDPKKQKSQRKLTTDEEKFHRQWTGQIAVVETASDVIKLIHELKN